MFTVRISGYSHVPRVPQNPVYQPFHEKGFDNPRQAALWLDELIGWTCSARVGLKGTDAARAALKDVPVIGMHHRYGIATPDGRELGIVAFCAEFVPNTLKALDAAWRKSGVRLSYHDTLPQEALLKLDQNWLRSTLQHNFRGETPPEAVLQAEDVWQEKVESHPTM